MIEKREEKEGRKMKLTKRDRRMGKKRKKVGRNKERV